MGMGAGQAAAIAPDVGKAKPAMLSIFGLLDTVCVDSLEPHTHAHIENIYAHAESCTKCDEEGRKREER